MEIQPIDTEAIRHILLADRMPKEQDLTIRQAVIAAVVVLASMDKRRFYGKSDTYGRWLERAGFTLFSQSRPTDSFVGISRTLGLHKGRGGGRHTELTLPTILEDFIADLPAKTMKKHFTAVEEAVRQYHRELEENRQTRGILRYRKLQ